MFIIRNDTIEFIHRYTTILPWIISRQYF